MPDAATPTSELGEFLRSRRDALTPEQAGVSSYGMRRVPGLRREEIAQLAGVSVAYYTRLEQGQASRASDSIIDALARALQLRDDERAHLFELARPRPARRPRAPRPERAAPGALQLMDTVTGASAVLLGRRTDVLAWNPLGHALFAGHLPFDAPQDPAARPNLTRMLFLDPHTRELYRNWNDEAALLVASLRFVAGQYPDDRSLAELVGELSVKSAEFAALWAKHTVQLCSRGTKHLHHPEIGDLDLDYQALHLPDTDGQRLVIHTAARDSSSAHALSLLARSHDKPEASDGMARPLVGLDRAPQTPTMTALPAELRALIDAGPLARLTAINADGSPHVNVIWIGLNGDQIVSGHPGPRLRLGVRFRDICAVWIAGSGGDNSIINGVGGPVSSLDPGKVVPVDVSSYP